jgi:hypothetical protein
MGRGADESACPLVRHLIAGFEAEFQGLFHQVAVRAHVSAEANK